MIRLALYFRENAWMQKYVTR